jgi:tetratricopeptide (TPR) repeat protein
MSEAPPEATPDFGAGDASAAQQGSDASEAVPAPAPPTAELALSHLDDAATALQREGRFLEALECMERGLVLRQRFYGPRSAEVFASCKAAGELCNLLAMTFLQKEDYAMATELLKKAEILTENEPGGRAVTYNNLACFARQQGRLHAALSFLQKALRIEEMLERVENPADTHLNLCAVLSQLGKHPEALQHGIAALTLLQDELFSDATAASAAAQKPDRVAVLAICYHNIGVEYEFLKDFEAAAQAYTKGARNGRCCPLVLGHTAPHPFLQGSRSAACT